MKDPYEVLGVSKNASLDEIKEAYKSLIKKYHPDKYQNNPLADLAQEKIKEINEAYDYLCKEKGGQGGYGYGGNQSSYGGSQNTYGSSTNSAALSSVRTYIDMGNLDAAATVLNNVTERTAEWYFLSGMVAYRRGWYDEARNLVAQASSMDPNNLEYRRNLDAMRSGGFGRVYRSTGYNSNMNVNDAFCRACEAYMCLDCLCDCF